MATTTHKGWTLIPQGTRPYTTQFNALIGEIDDSVNATDTQVATDGTDILALGGGANLGKLKRVDTGEWEEMQAGVIYYAPMPFLIHGSKARFYSGRITSAGANIQILASGASKPLAIWGWLVDSAYNLPSTIGYSPSNYHVGAYTDAGALYISRGSSLDDSSDTLDYFVVFLAT